jgi:hypothetical protein
MSAPAAATPVNPAYDLVYAKRAQEIHNSIYEREYDEKEIYKTLFKLQKKLDITNLDDDDHCLLIVWHLGDKIIEVLKYLIFIQNKNLLIFAPKLEIYLSTMMNKYEELENGNYHTFSTYLEIYEKTFYTTVN